LHPGDIAATAGTSGVVYCVTDKAVYDPLSRVNTFVHVNDTKSNPRNGVLLCINGTGISNSWIRKLTGNTSYGRMNDEASRISPGSDSLLFIPFGNGAERMLENTNPGASFMNLDFNRHTSAHMFRAVQEGIAFAFRYGLDILREMGITPGMIRAGRSNLFLSPVFTHTLASLSGVPVELYNTDGSVGAAILSVLKRLNREQKPQCMKRVSHHGKQNWSCSTKNN
jgi:xylulokinase